MGGNSYFYFWPLVCGLFIVIHDVFAVISIAEAVVVHNEVVFYPLLLSLLVLFFVELLK